MSRRRRGLLRPPGRRLAAEQVVLAVKTRFRSGSAPPLSLAKPTASCALGDGPLRLPCDRRVSRDDYHQIADGVRAALGRDVRPILDAGGSRLLSSSISDASKRRGCAGSRPGSAAGGARYQRLRAIAAVSRSSLRQVAGAWEIHVIRHGRLAAAALARPGEVPQAAARAAVAAAEAVRPAVGPQPAALVEESERIAAWSNARRPPDRYEGEWAWPIFSAASTTQRSPPN